MARPVIALALALPVALSATTAGADAAGIRIGASYWDFDISGTARYQSPNPIDAIDVTDDLGYGSDSLTSFYAVIEHPAPLIPNVRLAGTGIDTDANGNLSRDFNWGNVSFNVNEDVQSEVQLDQVDLALYWRILDNAANLDIGFNLRHIKLDATITGIISGSDTADVSGLVPMLYAGAGIDLPLTGLGIGADAVYSGYDGNSFYDFTVRATYTGPWHLGVEAGYRRLKLELDDFDDTYADIEFDGPYAGIFLHL